MKVPMYFVSKNWHKTPEGKEIRSALNCKNSNSMKIFGLLERPTFSPPVIPDEFQYKLFICGKVGVGKSCTVANLTGNAILKNYHETSGIQVSTVYWPVHISEINKVVIFNLQFWDAGENALKKFDHILPACKDKVDGFLFLFSFTDKSSFEELPHLMARMIGEKENPSKFIIGTKIDQFSQCNVTQKVVKDFEKQWNIPIVLIKNKTDSIFQNTNSKCDENAYLLDHICDQLWLRDQILAGRVKSPNE